MSEIHGLSIGSMLAYLKYVTDVCIGGIIFYDGYYKSPKLVEKIKQSTNNIHEIDLLVMIISSNSYVLSIPSNIFRDVNNCEFNFYVCPLLISTKVDHWNLLIFDIKNKIVERFEPYSIIEDNLDKNIMTFFESNSEYKYRYIKPIICPRPQKIEEGFKNDETYSCGYWTLLFLEYLLSYNSISSAMRHIVNTAKDNYDIIEHFSPFFSSRRTEIKRINDEYNDRNLKTIIKEKYDVFYILPENISENMFQKFIGHDGKNKSKQIFEEVPEFKELCIYDTTNLSKLSDFFKTKKIVISNINGFIIMSSYEL